ncbi:MAG: S-layer homology domain-containing protein, partial [Filifactor alocis]|nr:S-layer homology domain-containing protein [Filifactor alocis]
VGEIVTREDLLRGVRAVDEIEGDLTDKIEVIPSVGWHKGKLDTRFLDEGNIVFRVLNSRGRVFYQSVKLKIVKEKPEDQDVIPPVFEGLESKTFYVGEVVDRQRLLEGVKALDDVDGDITDRITLSKDTILTQEERDENILYRVRDSAGNETSRIIRHRVIEKPLDVEENDEKIRQIVRSIGPRYYATGQDWEAVDLAIAGKAEFIHTQTLLTKAQEVIRQEPKKATEYERIILSLTAAGLDARDIPDGNGSKIDLVDKITSFETMGTINDYIWALQALDSGKYPADKQKKWNRETLINYLLEKQLSDGSWNLNDQEGRQVDVDITAMAITALSSYRDREDVRRAIDKALDCLGRVKTKDYCFIYGPGGAETSESSSMVLIALASVGIDPNTDNRFAGSSKSVVTGLLSFATKDNEFKHVKVFTPGYTPSPNALSTEQAYRALSVYLKSRQNDHEPFNPYGFADFGGGVQPIDPGDLVTLVKLEVIKAPDKVNYQVGEPVELRGLEVKATYSDGRTEVLSTDELEVYGADTGSTGYKKITLSYKGLKAILGITVERGGNSSGGSQSAKAKIEVRDPKGSTYFPMKEMEIEEGRDTAFSLLQKTGLDYEYNFHPKYEGVYVSSIEGLAEFDAGPQSGWMYKVNGVFPDFSSSLKILKDGDEVQWLYTRDLGNDLGHGFAGGASVGGGGGGGQGSASSSIKIDLSPIKPEGSFRAILDPSFQKILDARIKEGDQKNDITLMIQTEKDIRAIELPLDGQSLDKLTSKEGLNLAIKSDLMDLRLDSRTLRTLQKLQKKTGAGVEIQIKKIEDPKAELSKYNSLSEEQRKNILASVKDRPFFDIDIKGKEGEIRDLRGGRIGVKLPYKLRAGEGKDDLKVWRIGEDSKIEEVSSDYDAIQAVMSFETDRLSYYAVGEEIKEETEETKKAQIVFGDVKENAWYAKAVYRLAQEEILRGKEDGNFHPESRISRAEFVTLLKQLSKEKSRVDIEFKDVKKGTWYHPSVAWAVEHEIAAGYGEEFRPNADITREEMAVMLDRFVKSYESKEVQEREEKIFADEASISVWAKTSVTKMQQRGVIEGKEGGRFAPKENATRAEAAQMIYALLEE